MFGREHRAGDLDVSSGAVRTYAGVLGAEGLASYRRLAEDAWAGLPPLGAGDRGTFDGHRFRVTTMMAALAGASGDVDAVVAVLAKDQSAPCQFVRIAERLRAAGRFPDALSWAERGLECFGPQADHRLLAVAAEGHHCAGQGHRAVELAWAAFAPRPSPAASQRLHAQGTRAGTWDAWRPRALARLRAEVTRRIAAARGSGSRHGIRPPWGLGADASDLAEVFLLEADPEQAWAEAKAGRCSPSLWLELARRREADHPEDAIPIFQDEVERLIGAKNNDAYRQAADLMAHLGALMREAAQPDAFGPYAAAVRARHRPKRNLMKLLGARRW